MTDEGVLNNYIEKLVNTDSPHLILASIFKVLFDRDLQAREWGQLRKMINLYGRWRLLEALLRAGSNQTFDPNGKNCWAYFNTICISLIEDEKDLQESIFKCKRQKEDTQKLIEDLSTKREKIKIKDKTWLIYNNA
jgi:hypothetical protein